MSFRIGLFIGAAALTGVVLLNNAHAQSISQTAALQLLIPFSVLDNTALGKAAVAANLKTTLAIQNGSSDQPGLQNFAAQQGQALRDAFITSGNAAELADGLGSKLGAVYQSKATVSLGVDSKPDYGQAVPSLENLFAYSSALSSGDSNAAKFFLAAEVEKSGTLPAMPVPKAEADIMTSAGGMADVYGIAYNLSPPAPKADKYGDSRPYQVAGNIANFSATDYFGKPANNADYLTGADETYNLRQDLTTNPAFPSGHTTYGTTESLLLAIMIPERFTQMMTRAAEYGNSRIVMGAHYAMDVIAGRTLAYYDMAQLLADKPGYAGQPESGATPIGSYPAAVKAAAADLRKALAADCGGSLKSCAADDQSRFNNAPRDQAFYESTLNYGLPVVYPAMRARRENVALKAPEAGYLLTTAFPYLSLAKADQLLTMTEAPGGGFLDNGKNSLGVYSRLDLYKAGLAAQAMAPVK